MTLRFFKLAVACVALIFVGLVVVVRVTPVPAAEVHQGSYPSGLGQQTGFEQHTWRARQKGDGVQQMAQFDAIIRATPRTKWLAGSVEEGMITYVTRSKWLRYPDITNVQRNIDLIEGGPPAIAISGRSYYGKLDFGVNKRRIQQWLFQIEAGG